MKGVKNILVNMALGFGAIWLAYDWIWIEEGPQFFMEDWRRIALAFGIALAGGAAVIVFSKFLPAIRKKLTTLGFVVVGVASFCWAAYAVSRFANLFEFLNEMNAVWPVACIAAIVAAFVSVAIWSALKLAQRLKRRD